MAVIYKNAPGKIILLGEHAVVYGQPAIAIPVSRVKTTARIFPNITAAQGSIRVQAVDIDLDAELSDLPDQHPLAAAVYFTLEAINPQHIPSINIQVTSSIPISAGMGSSAATSVAIIGALSSFLGKPLPTSTISNLAYEVEKIHHGTPSGIDNTVIAYQLPIYYQKSEPIEFLKINQPTYWLIADTGEKTPTHATVSAVREMHTHDPDRIETIFRKIGEITQNARTPLIEGDATALGELLDENQRFLQGLDLSSAKLDSLIRAAKSAGASGAKLSGGGRGGNMIAVTAPEKIEQISASLKEAGAVRIITTQLAKYEER
jgi:mevalonate kinase